MKKLKSINNIRRKCLLICLSISTPFITASASYAQNVTTPTPLDWIASKTGAANNIPKGQSLAKRANTKRQINRSDQAPQLRNHYSLKISRPDEFQAINSELESLYGRPSKIENSEFIWYVPNTDIDKDHSAMSSITLSQNPQGHGRVIVKKMSRPKAFKQMTVTRKSDF